MARLTLLQNWKRLRSVIARQSRTEAGCVWFQQLSRYDEIDQSRRIGECFQFVHGLDQPLRLVRIDG